MRRRVLVIAAAVVLAVAGLLVGLRWSGALSHDDDAETTGAALPAAIPGDGPSGPMHRLWSRRVLGFAPDGGQVLVTMPDGVAALDVRTGAQRWRYRRTDGRGFGGVAVTGATVVAAFSDQRGSLLVGLDEAHGTRLWTQDGWGLGEGEGPAGRFDVPAGTGGTVYAVRSGNTVGALDARTGAVRWQAPFGGTCDSRLTLLADRFGVAVVQTCGGGGVTVVDPNGHVRWTHDVSAAPGTLGSVLPLGVGAGMVAAGRMFDSGVVYSADGRVVENCDCTHDVSGQFPEGTAASLVFVSATSGQRTVVTAYDENTGAPRWRSTQPVRNGQVTVGRSRVFVWSASPRQPLVELDTADGAVRGTFPAAGLTTVDRVAIAGGAYLALTYGDTLADTTFAVYAS